MIPNAPRTNPPRAYPQAAQLDRARAVVAACPLFQGGPPALIDALLSRMQLRVRPAGAVLLTQDEPGDALEVIVDGRARVCLFGESGRELTLAELRPGDFFGEASLIDGGPASAHVVALEATATAALPRELFQRHLLEHPATAQRLLSVLVGRLRRADETIAELALHDVEARLLRTLERLAREDGEASDAGLLLRRRPTQQDLANRVGSCRETVSRIFASMMRRGLIVPRGRALLLTRALLERLVPAAVAA